MSPNLARALACALFAVLSVVPVLAQSPSLLVVNKAENSLAVLDPATGKVISRAQTGDGPHEVALSADGKTAFVTNYGAKTPGSSLSVIDVASAKETHRVDLGPLRRPHGIIVSGGFVYFTIEANRALARYDPSSNTVDWLMGTGEGGTHMVVATPDGANLFTSNIGSDSVTALARGQGGQGWSVTRIPVGKGPEAIDVSPDGKEVWTAHLQDGGVSIIDVATRKVTQTFDIGTRRSNRLRFTPDGRLVLVSDLEAGTLVVLDRATRKEVKRLQLGKAPSGILAVPDGSRAYVALTGENALAVVDLKTLETIGRVATGAGPDGMAWR
ncbi:MAG: YncE family protein [Acidobacteria bacterium]|nr:MAG: YncE family protein [Acidobacteriota bacterium]